MKILVVILSYKQLLMNYKKSLIKLVIMLKKILNNNKYKKIGWI